MLELLASHPLLLLFLVAAAGVTFGRLPIFGVRFGVAAVLFAGLAAGALDPRLGLPEIVHTFGLVLFVYTIGLASGPAFVASLRRRGVRDNLVALGVIGGAALAALLLARVLGLTPALAAGLFAGALTNTPALAAALEALERSGAATLQEPVVAYSVAYPGGVLGAIAAIALAGRLWRTDYAAERHAGRDLGVSGERVESVTVRVESRAATAGRVGDLRATLGRHVILGRYRHDDRTDLVHGDTRLERGDLVSVIGAATDVRAAARALGTVIDESLAYDTHEFDFRRVFVSNPAVAGRTLAELDLPHLAGALVTRVRRGDSDFLPHGDTRLELGDRVRIVARRDRIPELTRLFGDSYRAVSEIDVVTLGLGVAAGLLLGSLALPLPGGGVLRLGVAGGPLVVALALGALHRTGPIHWGLPYGASLTLRQLGLTLFLAGIGTRAGGAFLETLGSPAGLTLLAAGLALTAAVSVATLWIGHRLLKIPMSVAIGMLAGIQTQPAVLAYANEQTGNDLPGVGYATVYPLAMIAKIAAAQLLLLPATGG